MYYIVYICTIVYMYNVVHMICMQYEIYIYIYIYIDNDKDT